MHVSRICSDLVKIRSENPPGLTADVIEYIRDFLEKLGVRSVVSESAGGMCNLVTEYSGTALLLCGSGSHERHDTHENEQNRHFREPTPASSHFVPPSACACIPPTQVGACLSTADRPTL